MTWTKFGDEYPAEAEPLSDAAWRTHGEALMWSNDRLLDLRVPKAHLQKFANTPDPDSAVAELIAAGWWADEGSEWDIGLRYPEWQMERDEVLAARARATARMKRVRRHRRNDHSLCEPKSCPDAVPNVRANVQANAVDNPVTSELGTVRPNVPLNVRPCVPGTGRVGSGRVGTTSLPTLPGAAVPASPREPAGAADPAEHLGKIREQLGLKTSLHKQPPPDTEKEAARQKAALDAWAADNGIEPGNGP